MSLLEISNLSHHFGGLLAISDFELKLQPGELVGIIGPNGAGKSTLFNLITGIYRPDAGSIAINGTELVGKHPHQVTRLGIARTFQNIRLLKNLTVFDNLRVAYFGQSNYSLLQAMLRLPSFRAEEKRISEAAHGLLKTFGLTHYAAETASSLPYGVQRRLEIARAIATQPKVLLLDEPAAGMNPAEVMQLEDLIQFVRETFHLTILLIEHQMRLVSGLCERLLVLDFGVTIAQGTLENVRNNPLVLEAYLGEEPA